MHKVHLNSVSSDEYHVINSRSYRPRLLSETLQAHSPTPDSTLVLQVTILLNYFLKLSHLPPKYQP